MSSRARRLATPSAAGAPGRGAAGLGALLILAGGLLHAAAVSEAFEEQTYVGVLFVLNGLGAIVVCVGLVSRPASRAFWAFGAVIAGGAFVGFILSRTTGLPSFKEDAWEPLGLVSLVLEAGFLLLAVQAFPAPPPRSSTGVLFGTSTRRAR
jgi:hypothetical protein